MLRSERHNKKNGQLGCILFLLFIMNHSVADAAGSRQWTLKSLLMHGQSENPRVFSGISSLNAAAENENAARQEYFPTPSVQVRRDPDGRDETVLSLNQPVYSGGRIESNIDKASAQSSSASADVAVIQYDLSLSIIDNYQRLIQARMRQAALTSFGERLSFYRMRMNNRVAAGASPANDGELLDARMATNAVQLRTAQEEEQIALTQLSQLTSLELEGAQIATETDISSPPLLKDIQSTARDHNPALMKLTHEIAAAEAEVKAQRSSLIPSVSLVAEHSILHGSNSLNGEDTSISLQVSLTPGAGISAFSRTKAAQEQVYALRANRDATQQELMARIQSDYERLSSVISRQEEVRLNARAAESVLASYERLFVAGKRSWLDVMNAARDLSDADIAVADNVAERLGTRYRLYVYANTFSVTQHSYAGE